MWRSSSEGIRSKHHEEVLARPSVIVELCELVVEYMKQELRRSRARRELLTPAEVSSEENDIQNNYHNFISGPDTILGHGSHTLSTKTSSKHLDVEELEMLLEAYFVQIDSTLNNLSTRIAAMTVFASSGGAFGKTGSGSNGFCKVGGAVMSSSHKDVRDATADGRNGSVEDSGARGGRRVGDAAGGSDKAGTTTLERGGTLAAEERINDRPAANRQKGGGLAASATDPMQRKRAWAAYAGGGILGATDR
ncbi:Magnesium transporter MRS2-3 [Platanthera guangdongensis]|uniref:Magnesium transporter MRS2-3 n=1 Tax=Platanthera guangdongensis TaxID=2320717 RepID=A0ABR2N049_9ASPA